MTADEPDPVRTEAILADIKEWAEGVRARAAIQGNAELIEASNTVLDIVKKAEQPEQ